MSSKNGSEKITKAPQTYGECGFNESIDTAFATLQETQIELSHMADSKANIMITVCSILLTLVVAQLQRDILIFPSVIFAVFATLALFFAILCVMPSSNAPKLESGDVDLPKPFNLMFFMNFSQISIEKFQQRLEIIMTDPQELYENLSRDVYYAGKTLAEKKYRYLRWSYICLMLGIVFGGITLSMELIGSL